MGINTTAKGNRIELKAKNQLKENGYLVDSKPRLPFRRQNYKYSPDLFGQFDILAINDECVRLIQIKSNRSDFYKARKKISRWVDENSPTLNADFEVWLYEGNNDWRKEFLERDIPNKEDQWISNPIP